MFLTPLPPTFDAALRDHAARNPRFRLAAAERLATPPAEREDEARDALHALLADPLGPIRAAAARSLGSLTPVAATLETLRAAIEDEHLEVQVAALGSAAALAPASWLRAYADDPRAALRRQALLLLPDALAGEATKPLRAHLEDEDEGCRAAAARGLGLLAPEDHRDALAARLGDAPAVALEAAFALASAGDARAAPTLLAAMRTDLAVESAEALGALPLTTDERDQLAEHADRLFGSLLVRAAAGAALARQRDPRGEPALARVLTARRADGRDYAVRSVGTLALDGQLPALVALARRLRGTDPFVLDEALSAFPDDPEARRARERLRPHIVRERS